MGLIKGIQTFVRGFFPIKDIQTALEVRPAVSRELIELTELWYNCYIGEAPWLGQDIDGSITESLRLEQSVVRELANVVTNEMTAEISDEQLREQFGYMLYMLPSELQKGLRQALWSLSRQARAAECSSSLRASLSPSSTTAAAG